ncbi:MAG: NAD-dependent epimerase/dehydratase family protein [Pseudomonadota bacterium]
MTSYLVTGGAGFIGSHLVESLLADGHRVRVLDNLSTGSRSNLPEDAELLVDDLADYQAVRDAMDGVDKCFHLAAVASVERCNRDWPGTSRINLGGTIHVLDCARALGGVPVVYASSAAIYGTSRSTPLREDLDPNPVSSYGADKLACEIYARVAAESGAAPATGMRIFNVYGPRQSPESDYSGVISIFIERLSRGLPLVVNGDGRQVRDFVYIDDVVRTFRAAMDLTDRGAKVFNICTGRATSILELAETLSELYQVSPQIDEAPPRLGDVRTSIGDPRAAIESLGVECRTPLREGLRQTIESQPRELAVLTGNGAR